MKHMSRILGILFLILVVFMSCSKDNESTTTDDTSITECSSDQLLDSSRGACNETLPYTNSFIEVVTGTNRIISSNSIPNHLVGLFGNSSGSLNPNAISEQNATYTITMNPTVAASTTSLLGSDGPDYSFGILLNGVELDPIAAEPFPHQGAMNVNANWEWNLEALNVQIGLDCNNAHVQPTGKYHYHGSPVLFLEASNIPTNSMTLVGYAADGFPIYYKYAYVDAADNASTVVAMTSSYQLRSGERGGDGVTAPCDTYNGVYSADYEYIEGFGTLDSTNGRTGVTPEYPGGTFYYVITDEFPSIPRFFKGTPSIDFKIGM